MLVTASSALECFLCSSDWYPIFPLLQFYIPNNDRVKLVGLRLGGLGQHPSVSLLVRPESIHIQFDVYSIYSGQSETLNYRARGTTLQVEYPYALGTQQMLWLISSKFKSAILVFHLPSIAHVDLKFKPLKLNTFKVPLVQRESAND